MLSQVKWFMTDLTNKALFVNVTTFQGSNDNITWTELFAMDENIHDGWNYHNWENAADYPKY